MRTKPKSSYTARDTVATGLAALEAGDLETAHRLLSEAVRVNRRDPGILVNLGLTLQRLGEIDEAAAMMCDALALKPRSTEVARRFSALVRRFHIKDPGTLNTSGLKAALEFDTLDRQAFVDLALAHCLTRPELSQALARVRAGNADEAADSLLGKRTAGELGNELLLAALRRGKNTDPWFEQLLTVIRRFILLTLPAERFYEDRRLYKLFLALVAQAIQNEHVWPQSEAETRALAALDTDGDELLAGDIEHSRRVCLQLLYHNIVDTALHRVPAANVSRIRPKSAAALLAGYVGDRDEETKLAKTIPRIGTITDPVSLRVAEQYEKNPYPRWTSLHVSQPGALRRYLTQATNESRLSFMDGLFDVLIAGCGTGHQAALAASAYGENARVLGIDLSVPSLAYGRRMCAKFGFDNVEFAHADIHNAALLDRKFDVIECVGVLHHMANPFAGWRTLLDRLKPGGLMYIGLYSAVSRANIAALRQDTAYPFPGCSDEEVRAFRALLMSREEGEPGAELRSSGDFYSLSEFRDLALHESEQHLTLEQIESFLGRAGLTFVGFALDPHTIGEFTSRYPNDPLPGGLAHWAELERERTSLFDGMYLFWCTRTD